MPADRPTAASWRPYPLTADPPPEKNTLGDEPRTKLLTGLWSLAKDGEAPGTLDDRGSTRSRGPGRGD